MGKESLLFSVIAVVRGGDGASVRFDWQIYQRWQ